MKVKVKVCGMRERSNILELYKLRPDYVGFIFYPQSKRYVGTDFDPTLTEKIPSDIGKFGVFVNEEIGSIMNIQERYQFDYLQLHGDETSDYCKKLKSKGYKLVKAFSIDSSFDFDALQPYAPYCDFFLFDTKGDNYGGNGIRFDWTILDKYKLDRPFFLSGGIGLEELEELKTYCHPKLQAIDVNSRFETVPGIKNLEKVNTLIQQVRNLEE